MHNQLSHGINRVHRADISCAWQQSEIIGRLIPAQILLVPSVTALEEGRFWSVMDVCPVRYRTGEGLTMVSYEYMSRPLHPKNVP